MLTKASFALCALLLSSVVGCAGAPDDDEGTAEEGAAVSASAKGATAIKDGHYVDSATGASLQVTNQAGELLVNATRGDLGIDGSGGKTFVAKKNADDSWSWTQYYEATETSLPRSLTFWISPSKNNPGGVLLQSADRIDGSATYTPGNVELRPDNNGSLHTFVAGDGVVSIVASDAKGATVRFTQNAKTVTVKGTWAGAAMLSSMACGSATSFHVERRFAESPFLACPQKAPR